ncbi:MAG: hypothetical protein ACT4PJ_15820 [Gemmatimonadaceae bacterium]
MHARQFRGLLAIAMFAPAMGCAASVRPDGELSTFREGTTARVTNNGWLDINVYAWRAGARMRLGTVGGQSTKVFRLPHYLVDARGVQIFVDAIGSEQSYRTEVIPVARGQQIDLVVLNRLTMSHYAVFDP